ncbi:MAG: UDP-N-acetylmuramoyl-tripeptide--D-alanyl-D-alanine ligase [Bryobacteraceae bacterium]|jgi:UDP-N-acetylmuramoyl-tripeptide--D-alanyl-D-alanine ligase
MKLALREVGRVLGAPLDSGAIVTGWSVDSRSIEPGDFFFALRGPNHDGTAYIDAALTKGAVGVTSDPGALEKLATWARIEWGGDVVAITGSAGKTSTKDVVAELLASELSVGKTAGNFNNQVGLPLSILRLPDEARVAVLEIGMNHAGEIRHLCSIAKPRIGVVTNVGYAHIEMFDSIDGIALAKRELIECLPSDGTAVLNEDDPRVRTFGDVHDGPVVRFGFSETANVRARDVEFRSDGTRFRVCGTTFHTSLQGRHAVLNILAGIAVAQIYGIAPAKLVDVIANLKPGKMRGERFTHNGITILDDCYNSNPDAVHAMLDVLKDTPAIRRVAVLGEMLELGRWSEPLHRDIGRYAVESGVNVLVGIRGAARAMVDAAIETGLHRNAAFFFDDPIAAGGQLRESARPGDAILFKGSRGTHVERALERFLE